MCTLTRQIVAAWGLVHYTYRMPNTKTDGENVAALRLEIAKLKAESGRLKMALGGVLAMKSDLGLDDSHFVWGEIDRVLDQDR